MAGPIDSQIFERKQCVHSRPGSSKFSSGPSPATPAYSWRFDRRPTTCSHRILGVPWWLGLRAREGKNLLEAAACIQSHCALYCPLVRIERCRWRLACRAASGKTHGHRWGCWTPEWEGYASTSSPDGQDEPASEDDGDAGTPRRPRSTERR